MIELKYEKSAETALQQIKNRGYAKVLEGYSGEVLFVGVSYAKDHKDKPHSCVIEKFRFS